MSSGVVHAARMPVPGRVSVTFEALPDIERVMNLADVLEAEAMHSEQRELIWRGIFPAATPLQSVDCAKLARLNMAGSGIRNIAINAAFLAAEAGSPIGMSHLLQAARQ